VNLDEIRAELTRQIADELLLRMPDEAKAKILAESLKEAISDYKFKQVITEKLRAESSKRISGMLEDAEFDRLFCEKFQAGVDLFMETLPKVVATAMVGTLIGPTEYKSGAIHKAMCEALDIERR
jgi:hypothetical protein